MHGQSFPDKHVPDNLVQKLPPHREGWFNIGLLHADVGGSADGQYAYCPFCRSDLLDKGYDYWALGHNHVRDELHADPYVVYSGNLQGRHIQETGVKGCTLVHMEDSRVQHLSHKSCDVVRWEHLRLDASQFHRIDDALDATHRAMEQLRTQCDPLDHPLVVRVTLHGNCPVHHLLVEHTEKLRAEVDLAAADWQIWPERVEVATTPARGPGHTLSAGFLAELNNEFSHLQNDPEALQLLLNELAPLDQMAATFQLSPKPTGITRAQTLLGLSADLLMARLQGGFQLISKSHDA